MDWTQLRVHGELCHREEICAVMCMLDSGIQIEDYSDIDMKTCYADLIDEKILNADKNKIAVSIYVSADKPLGEYISYLKDRFAVLKSPVRIETVGVSEEEWSTSWRKYYHPVKIGKKLVISPLWEDYQAQENEIVVQMDPGMAFGTGTHETTRLCATLLEKYMNAGDRLLDLGTGSGILAICGAKLGASYAGAYDIDPMAVRVAGENAQINQVGQIVHCGTADLCKGVDISGGKFRICCANIVADIIIRLAPDVGDYLCDGAPFITSGIIDERADEVRAALENNGFTIMEALHDRGWCAFATKKQG